MTGIGCYVHIPFCVRKCAYCDFNSFSGYGPSAVDRYLKALGAEIQHASADASRHGLVDTVFFGGGTPTAIPGADQAALLQALFACLPIAEDAEITTEANPGTTDIAQLQTLRDAGFNRVSFGVQSFDAGLLKTLGRIHSADEARTAVTGARSAGFENVSIDLMFGLPCQTQGQWKRTLDEALALETEHLSMYSLIVEEGTGFHTLYEKGRLPLPSEDLAAEMYELAITTAQSAGYQQYEISNFAKPSRGAGVPPVNPAYSCRHNIHYWRNEPYYGFGCGAAAYLDGVRRTNIKSPAKYADIALAGGDLRDQAETLGSDDTMAETMMLGLRMTREGVDCVRFASRFGVDPRERYAETIAVMQRRGLLELAGDNLRLTPCGVFLGNEVMAAFL